MKSLLAVFLEFATVLSVLAAGLVFSFANGEVPEVVEPAPTDPEPRLTDVTEGKWYTDHVLFMYNEGLMVGTSNTTFSPSAMLTRAMSVQILYKMADPSNMPPHDYVVFKDVPLGKWYSKAVLWSYINKITAGIGGWNFGPNLKITRAELITFLQKYASYSGLKYKDVAEYSYFADELEIPDYAKLAVQNARQAGIIAGRPGNLFAPSAPVTRAEAATIIHMFICNTESGLLRKNNLKATVTAYIDKMPGLGSDYNKQPHFGISIDKIQSDDADYPGISVYAKVTSKYTSVESLLVKRDDTYNKLVYGFPVAEGEGMGYVRMLNMQDYETLTVELVVTIGEESETLLFYPVVEVVE